MAAAFLVFGAWFGTVSCAWLELAAGLALAVLVVGSGWPWLWSGLFCGLVSAIASVELTARWSCRLRHSLMEKSKKGCRAGDQRR